LYRCSFECAERFRRTTALQQRECERRCRCDVYGCDEKSRAGTYCGDCHHQCPCDPARR
jgi:hypothetical protein